MTEDEGNELLLSHTAWLQALARSVVARRDLAADVAQETMMVAWRRGLAGVLDVRAYLAQILRRLASRRARGEQQRRQRELSAPPSDPVPSTVDLVSKASMQREVVDAVLRLSEPYRTAVLLRFLEERSYQDIATATEAPLETVRTRLKRGLQQLRQDLDRRHGDTKAWALPMLGLTGFQQATATATTGAAGAATGAGVVGAGVLLMSAQTKVWIGAAVMLTALLAWQFREQPVERAPGVLIGDSNAPVVVAAAPVAPLPGEADAERIVVPAAPKTAAEAPPSLPRWSAVGRVVDETTNGPVAGAQVRFTRGSNGRFVDNEPGVVTTAADGSFAFDCEGVFGFVELAVSHDDYAATHVPMNEVIARAEAAGQHQAALGDVLMARGAALAGRVLDADGATPLPGARILYYRASMAVPMQFFANAQEVAIADEQGHFALPSRIGPGYRRHWLVAVTEQRIGWRVLELSRRATGSRAFDITMLPAASLRLHVVDAAERPLAGATAVAWIASEPLSSTYDPASRAPTQQPLPAFLKAKTDAHGVVQLWPPITKDEFQLGTRVPGAQCELIVELPGHRTWRQRVPLTAGASPTIEVRLATEVDTTVTGVVMTKLGAAIQKARVVLGEATASTDSNGRFRFEHVDVSAGVLQVMAVAPGFVARREQVSCSDDRAEIAVEVRLDAARRLRGVVVDQDGSPVPQVFVACGMGTNAVTAADGRFELDGVAPTESLVVVMPQRATDRFDTTMMPLSPAVDGVVDELRIVVNRQCGGARVELLLVDRATGAGLEPVNCWLFPLAANGTQAVGRQLQIRDGLCFDESTPPGRYSVSAETRDGRRARREIEVLAGVPRVQERLLLDAPGKIRCTIDSSALSRLPQQLRLELNPSDGGRLSVPSRNGTSPEELFAVLLDPSSERLVEVLGATPDVPLTLRVLDADVVGEVTTVVASDAMAIVELRLLPAGIVQFVSNTPAAFDLLLVQWQRPDAGWSSLQQLMQCRGKRELGEVRVPVGSVAWRVSYALADGTQETREGRVEVASGVAAVVHFD